MDSFAPDVRKRRPVAALFVALGGTTYAATGGNFILGQPNTASAPTQLSSPTTNASGALKVSNTSTTTPGRGITAAGGAGGYGLYASGGNHAKNTAAVHGQSAAGNAVEGFSTANPASGVFGQDNNANSYGVAGHSDNGVAVVGDSSKGWAMQALGNATQSRDKGGFVKAMVDVVGGTGRPVLQPSFHSARRAPALRDRVFPSRLRVTDWCSTSGRRSFRACQSRIPLRRFGPSGVLRKRRAERRNG